MLAVIAAGAVPLLVAFYSQISQVCKSKQQGTIYRLNLSNTKTQIPAAGALPLLVAFLKLVYKNV